MTDKYGISFGETAFLLSQVKVFLENQDPSLDFKNNLMDVVNISAHHLRKDYLSPEISRNNLVITMVMAADTERCLRLLDECKGDIKETSVELCAKKLECTYPLPFSKLSSFSDMFSLDSYPVDATLTWMMYKKRVSKYSPKVFSLIKQNTI